MLGGLRVVCKQVVQQPLRSCQPRCSGWLCVHKSPHVILTAAGALPTYFYRKIMTLSTAVGGSNCNRRALICQPLPCAAAAPGYRPSRCIIVSTCRLSLTTSDKATTKLGMALTFGGAGAADKCVPQQVSGRTRTRRLRCVSRAYGRGAGGGEDDAFSAFQSLSSERYSEQKQRKPEESQNRGRLELGWG